MTLHHNQAVFSLRDDSRVEAQSSGKLHPFKLAIVSRLILLTMRNEERSLTPLVVIYRQNTLVKEQEGGYDEHAWQHITDSCGYHPPVSSYIALCRPPRYPVDQHAAGRSDAHAPIHRLAHNDWYPHARRGHRFADRGRRRASPGASLPTSSADKKHSPPYFIEKDTNRTCQANLGKAPAVLAVSL